MSNPTVSYDRNADVLYVTYEAVPALHGVETAEGLIKRYAEDDKLVGITIVCFSDWLRALGQEVK